MRTTGQQAMSNRINEMVDSLDGDGSDNQIRASTVQLVPMMSWKDFRQKFVPD